MIFRVNAIDNEPTVFNFSLMEITLRYGSGSINTIILNQSVAFNHATNASTSFPLFT